MQTGLGDGNSNPYWCYIRGLRQDHIGVSPLNNDGRLKPDGLRKAEILSRQFKQVFINKVKINIDRSFSPNFLSAHSLILSQKDVENVLYGLDVSKTSGLDPADYLKFVHWIRPSHVCHIHLELEYLPSDWLTAYMTPIVKMELVVPWRIQNLI